MSRGTRTLFQVVSLGGIGHRCRVSGFAHSVLELKKIVSRAIFANWENPEFAHR